MNISTATAATRTRTTSYMAPGGAGYSVVGWAAVGVGDHDDGRAVGHDLGHRLADLRRVEPDEMTAFAPISVAFWTIRSSAWRRVSSRSCRVLVDLAAHDRAEAGREVAREAAAAHDEAEDLALRLLYAPTGDERGCRGHHGLSLRCVACVVRVVSGGRLGCVPS